MVAENNLMQKIKQNRLFLSTPCIIPQYNVNTDTNTNIFVTPTDTDADSSCPNLTRTVSINCCGNSVGTEMSGWDVEGSERTYRRMIRNRDTVAVMYTEMCITKSHVPCKHDVLNTTKAEMLMYM